MIDAFLTISILIWPFGQLLSLAPFGQIFRVQLLDLCVLLLFLSLLPQWKKIIKDPLFRPLCFFIAAAAASLLLAFIEQRATLAALFYLFRFVIYTSIYFGFSLRGINRFRRHLSIAVIIFLLLGFLQYFFYPDMRFLKFLGFDDHYFRLVGSFFDPNFTGAVLAVIVMFLPIIPALITLLALALTFSRAAYLSFALGFGYLALARRRYHLIAVILLLLIFIVIIPKPSGEGVNLLRTFSIESRITNQVSALTTFRSHPVLGVGFNTLKTGLTSGVDNSYLFVLTTTGIIGLVFFLNFLIKAWVRVNSKEVRAGLLIIFCHSLFNNSLFYSWILAIFFLLIASASVSKPVDPDFRPDPSR